MRSNRPSTNGHPRIPGARAGQVVLRSLHIAAMALVLGGLAQGAGFGELRPAILATVASGILLMALDLVRGCLVLTQGSGVALLLKLGLLGLGHLLPGHRLGWYFAATLVAGIGSHMSGTWRHFDFRTGRVAESD